MPRGNGFGGGAIYYPTATNEGTFGAVAVSPGLNGTWAGIAWLGPRLASPGFVVFGMYQLAYRNPTLVPGTDFPLGAPHAADINLKFANTDKNLDNILNSDQSPGRRATARHMSGL